MRFDLHLHLAADPPGGELSARFQRSLPFRWLRVATGQSRRPMGAPGVGATYRSALVSAVETMSLDGAVVLALDRPFSEVGLPLAADLFVANGHAAEVCRLHPKLRFGASVHPDRPDADAALDAAVAEGAALCKWLPNAQRLDPLARRYRRFYARLRELDLPLLSHTGDEHTLPGAAQHLGELRRLIPALEAGVTVIAAHAGTGGRTSPREVVELCAAHPRLFLEVSALWTPTRLRPMLQLLAEPALRDRWVYGSDYPVPIFWPLLWRRRSPAVRAARRLANPLDRRAALAEALGVPAAAFHRGAELLRG